ncbi:MAG: GerMN domain-containing protein [Firmicutes bacterium]|nr:GerMN domain-containing protein [Bacillota bacterium]HOB21416.1 GerMN domain-containing protein [Bacillota bacterium]HQD39384.1 GerMN domain-containing protein [Bacillota bacterium]
MGRLASWLAILALIGVLSASVSLWRHNTQIIELGNRITELGNRISQLEKELESRKEQIKLNVYFTRDAQEVVPAKRTLQGEDQVELLKAAFSALLAGPTEEEKQQGLSSQLPADAKLLDVKVEDGIAYLDFSRELEQVGGSARVLGILKQIGFTATEVPGIEGAWLLIEGKKVEVFSGEGAIISEPLSRAGGAEF